VTITMAKKVLGLGPGQDLIIRLPDGRESLLPARPYSVSSVCFLVVDCSGSMQGKKLHQAASGARRFACDARRIGYEIGLISFDSSARVLSEPMSDAGRLEAALQQLAADGGTNMAAAILLAHNALSHRKGTRALVLVTDGAPDDRARTLMAARKAKESGIQVLAIGTDDADKEFLLSIASATELVVDVPAERLEEGITAMARLLPRRADPDLK
jgi:Mg-chelatase subunit ChlD